MEKDQGGRKRRMRGRKRGGERRERNGISCHLAKRGFARGMCIMHLYMYMNMYMWMS